MVSARTAWSIAIIVGAMLAASLPAAPVWAFDVSETDAVLQKDSPLRIQSVVPASPESVSGGTPQPAATEMQAEMDRRFNEFRRELLDQQFQAVHLWLTVLAIILTVMAVVFPIAAYLGFGRFHDIEQKALEALKETEAHARTAHRQVTKSSELTAEDALGQAFESFLNDRRAATETPDASPVETAVTEALTLQKDGRIAEAIAKWEAIATLVKDTNSEQAARAHHSVGYLYATSGAKLETGITKEAALKKSIRSYDEAIRLRPKSAASYYNRGLAKDRLKQYNAAIADFNEAIRLRPNHANSHYRRGFSKVRLEQYEAAIADLDEAIRLRSDFANSYIVRGFAKNRLEQYEAAIADLDEAIRLRSDSEHAYRFRANAWKALGQHEKAKSDREQAKLLRAETDQSESPAG